MMGASIDDLRDIHLPPPPGLWPPAPGWWLVLAIGAIVALLLVRRHQRRRPLQCAVRELDTLARAHAHTSDSVELARGISRVLRRYALWRFPQDRVAGLSGAAWLQFLDARGGHGAFTSGAGSVLGDLPYRPAATGAALSDRETEVLVALARQWLRNNAP